MRYSTALRSSRKHHILKHRAGGGLISLVWLIGILAVLLLIFHTANLDAWQLLSGFVVSLFRMSLAYLIALIIALAIAVVVMSNSVTETILLPILDVLQSFPSFALFPILVHTLQHSPETVIVTVLVIAMIWPILFSIIGGLKNRRTDLEEAATIFDASGWQRLRSFTLPQLFPAIVTGSIVGWGDGWELIIGAELLVHIQNGIGKYLGDLGSSEQTMLLMIGIVVFMLLLFIINKLVWLPMLHNVTQFETEA